ncbi:TetR/AcrR family transcriptional regulator [Oleidesulfovibrio alaskensis]|uniref:TetR/AcrR family transcriptional regulator n=1 Tax=Oleidesulfovibrio alaskensis TaxID=58180 RepID=UPI001A5485C2|nr:TetR/AcrR family transcriptional regulator [Oleidesulfovibrio alaskensis]MBL3582344.1 TetR/AcrR family transcriptional regulator [Oleidesulfovibrio alaskensis]
MPDAAGTYPPHSAKSIKHDVKRRIILDAARRMFAHDGAGSVSMRNLAREVGCSAAVLYRYFGSRESILWELRCEGIVLLNDALMGAADAADPLLRLQQLGRAYVSFGLDNLEYYELMFRTPFYEFDAGSLPDGLPDDALVLLHSTAAECLELGYFAGSDVTTVVSSMWSLVHGLVSLILNGRAPLMMGALDTHAMIDRVPDFIAGLARAARGGI